jgi:predicted transposase/invertase (TIGR01784 family)
MNEEIYDRLYAKLHKPESEEEKNLKNSKNDPEAKIRYDALFEARLEYNGAVSFAIIKGLEKGKDDGIIQGKSEVAGNALKEGLDIDLIVKITGLSKEEILKL